jgi:hypothetical protein
MKKSKLRQMIREELLKEDNNKLVKSRTHKYKVSSIPEQKNITYLLNAIADLKKATMDRDGVKIDNALLQLLSVYEYYFEVK